jgi:hypothetical protein
MRFVESLDLKQATALVLRWSYDVEVHFWRRSMNSASARKIAAAVAALVCGTTLSIGWNDQGGISLQVDKAQAATRLYVTPYYRGHYYTNDGLPWYAVRAYYFGGPWSYGYSGWTDYAARNGIGCVPGSLVKGGEGIMYVCQ